MANIPGWNYGWSELTDEIHCYIIVTSRNRLQKNMIYHGNLPGIY